MQINSLLGRLCSQELDPMTQHPTRFMTFSAADVGLPTQMESAFFSTIFNSAQRSQGHTTCNVPFNLTGSGGVKECFIRQSVIVPSEVARFIR